MSEKKKINWLLILQGWAMLWVVIGHAFLGKIGEGPVWDNVLHEIAYSFHMPLFIMISGYLFYLTRISKISTGGGINVYNSIIWDKIKRLLIPGFVFSLISLALKFIFPEEMSRQVSLSAGDIAHMYLYPYDNPMRELWFIVVLMWLFILYPLWKVSLHNKWTIGLTILILLVLHYIKIDLGLLCIDRVFKHAIWFYTGIVVCKEGFVDKALKTRAFTTLLIGVVIYLAGKYTISLITTIGGIITSLGIALLLNKYLPKAFFSFRNYTYQIFLIGIFAQMFVKILYRHVSVPYALMYVICIVMGLYIPVIVSKVIEKMNWTPLLLCVGLKKK